MQGVLMSRMYKVESRKYGKKVMATVLTLFAISCILFPAPTRGRA